MLWQLIHVRQAPPLVCAWLDSLRDEAHIFLKRGAFCVSRRFIFWIPVAVGILVRDESAGNKKVEIMGERRLSLRRGKSNDVIQQMPAQQWAQLIHPAVQSYQSVVNGENLVPVGMEKVLTAVAASVMHSASGMSKWGMADLTIGLYKLSGRHSLEGVADTITGVPVTNLAELDDMLQWLNWARAAYKKDKPTLAMTMKIREEDIVKIVNTSAVMKPAFFVVVHHQRRCVVMGIRGTHAATDVLTDLNPHSEAFEGGYAHSGMLAAARWLLDNEGPTLHNVLQSHPGYGLVLVGHSLGAGTATLLGLMLRESYHTSRGPFSNILKIPAAKIICWGFACPPCVDRNLAISSSFVYNVVLQDDVVARVSPAALEDLRSEIVQTEWNQAFKDGTTQRRVVEMVHATAERLGQVEMCPRTLELYNKAKGQGYEAIMNAGSAMVSKLTTTKGSQTKSAADWFTFGTAAAGKLLTSASDRVTQGVTRSLSSLSERNGQKSDEGVAAVAVAVNTVATTSTSKSKEDLTKLRLFVPGNLYQIIRQPLPPSQQMPTAVRPHQEGNVRHTVVRGTDPNSRFHRIVLSCTMLSDHSSSAYVDGIVDAMQYARR